MNNDPNWERQLLERLASAALIEQRRSRQWKIFFRLAWLAVIGFIAVSLFMRGEDKTGASLTGGGHSAVIELDGAISSENDSGKKMVEALESAFRDKGTKGVIIDANSPGGSPVLSGMVYDEIRRQKQRHADIPVYVVVSEVCASGCYYIASAADKIFVDKASIVGSIGVLSDGFGFTGAMEKLGIERRLKTAGENKAMGDPFSPQNPKHEAIRQQLLDDIHQQFIAAVRAGRGKRLKDDPQMFSGMVWLGEKAIPLGLADGYGTVASVARDVVKADKTVDFTRQDDFSSRVARRIGVEFAGGVKSLFNTELF
ncbi:S49 family peptidase [Chromobacterium sp. ATCC 53434]|uniref:S49 family peptidase n=1 Tax=Chromobacterium sp. (strain ATCC 53434 / SC 14030) TaxID=2059672 RepID=UPI000C7613D7|nr:S49 family peptidase [Chromobacterium sp. ATCC 53434]AUH51723.1 S49 family peptidase [Chromobacterium sp. ATCC 53434]